MPGALTQNQLLSFKQQIGQLLEQLQQEAHDLLAGTQYENVVMFGSDVEREAMMGDLNTQMAACREALIRIEAGLYGYCDCCGEVIELNHLKADPSVCRCVRCQRTEKRHLITMP